MHFPLIRRLHCHNGRYVRKNTLWLAGFVTEGVIIIFCNIIAIIIFARKVRQSKSCILLVNQSIADFLVGAGAVYFSLQYTNIESHASEENPVCRSMSESVKLFIWYVVIDASLSSLAFISLERALAVFKPFRHRTVKARTYYYVIVEFWLLCSTQCLAMILPRCESYRDTLIFIFSLGSLSGCLITIVVVYSSIYIKLSFFPNVHMNSQSRRQIKLCRTLFYASAASIVTVLPSIIEQIYSYVQNNQIRTRNSNTYEITMLLLFSNSFVNFFIYAWRFPEFSQELRRLFRWKSPIVNDLSAIEVGCRPGTNDAELT